MRRPKNIRRKPVHNVAKKLHIQEFNQEKSFDILRVFLLLKRDFLNMQYLTYQLQMRKLLSLRKRYKMA